jgi:hypothetical protein
MRRASRIAVSRTVIVLAALASLSAAPAKSTIVGTITDDMCASSGHAAMRMGPTDAECTKACVAAHGASYVLLDGKQIYTLSDQKLPEKFAGQKVKVVGTLDAKTKKIAVESITATK